MVSSIQLPLKTSCLILALSTLLGSAAPRDAEWGQVKQHLAKDLPKSAIAVLTTIDQQARAESAWPEALRATAQRVLLEGRIAEGRDAVGRIKGIGALNGAKAFKQACLIRCFSFPKSSSMARDTLATTICPRSG